MNFALIVALATIFVPSLIILFAYISERWQARRGDSPSRRDRHSSAGLPRHGARR